MSDLLRKWRELFQPIRELSKAKPKQTQHYFQHSIENCFFNQNLMATFRKPTAEQMGT